MCVQTPFAKEKQNFQSEGEAKLSDEQSENKI